MFKIGFFPHGAPPPILPITPATGLSISVVSSSARAAYFYTLFTVKATGGAIDISFNKSLVSGTSIPKIYYYINYPGVNSTGFTSIAALPSLTPNTPASVGFTEFRPGISLPVSLNLNDYVTLATFFEGGYVPGDVNIATGTINDVGNGGATVATFDLIKTVDF